MRRILPRLIPLSLAVFLLIGIGLVNAQDESDLPSDNVESPTFTLQPPPAPTPGAPGATPTAPAVPRTTTTAPTTTITPTTPSPTSVSPARPGQPARTTTTGQPPIQLLDPQEEILGQPVMSEGTDGSVKTILINFNNVNIIEFIRFISRISNKNFVFNEADLQFNVSIVSDQPTSVDNVMAALLQVLRIHGLTMFERGNNIIIHKNMNVNAISRVVSGESTDIPSDTEIVTHLFRLNTVDPERVAAVLRPLVSERSIVEVFKETNQIILTDIVSNVEQVAQLIQSLDAPGNGLVIGQYVVRNGYIDSLVQLAQKVMQPISQEQTLIFVPHRAANSIFIVSTPFLLERTMAILQYLDQNQGLTRIFDLNQLKFTPDGQVIRTDVFATPGGAPGVPGGPVPGVTTGGRPTDQWQVDERGNWVFRPQQQAGIPEGNQPPQGYWYVDENGNWHFRLGTQPPSPLGTRGLSGPEGTWRLDSQGFWVFQIAPGKSISPERLVRPQLSTAELPVGHIQRTQFYIYKMQYRKGDEVQAALMRVGESLKLTSATNGDLVQAIDSAQWIEASNALIFTGTVEALDKVQEFVREIDAPLHQVFIEMLILETTIEEALNYGVNWGTRFGGDNLAGSQAFLSQGSPLPAALSTAGVGLIPDAAALALAPGFSQGIIGQRITHCGLQFDSLGLLVKAIHNRLDTNVVMNPKILTEDNNPAEIFVGINTPFPTQAIANDRGEIITQNFEFRDVGIRLRVTPQIGDNGIITLTLYEEVSSIAPESFALIGTSGGPTTNKSTTTTKVHLPNEFFLVISGMIQDEDRFVRDQVPCLGGIPFIGAAFRDQRHRETKRNLMIFIRPRIIDSVEEIDNITKHQQDIFDYKNKFKDSWRYETDEAMDFLNLPKCGDDCCDDDCCTDMN